LWFASLRRYITFSFRCGEQMKTKTKQSFFAASRTRRGKNHADKTSVAICHIKSVSVGVNCRMNSVELELWNRNSGTNRSPSYRSEKHDVYQIFPSYCILCDDPD
jgi:hypothetical protein